jgi:predicted helicase
MGTAIESKLGSDPSFLDALELDPDEHCQIQKMTFARRTAEQKAAGAKRDKTCNSHITLSEIPLEAYDYVVNGKSAIE